MQILTWSSSAIQHVQSFTCKDANIRPSEKRYSTMPCFLPASVDSHVETCLTCSPGNECIVSPTHLNHALKDGASGNVEHLGYLLIVCVTF